MILAMEYLTAKEAAKRLRMCVKTFRRLHIPAFRPDNKRYLYRVEDLDAWVRSRIVYSGGETKPQRRKHGSRVPKTTTQMGVPKVLSWQELCAVSMGNKSRS